MNIQKKDNRIRSFHKKHGGTVDSRNFGLQQANGEYIQFVDSDDWISLDFLEVMVGKALMNNCDIVCCSIYLAYRNYLVILPVYEKSPTDMIHSAIRSFKFTESRLVK